METKSTQSKDHINDVASGQTLDVCPQALPVHFV